MKSLSPRGTALAKLHIAKKDLAMDDDAYKALLVRHGAPAESPSARELTINQIDSVLKELIGKGWQPGKTRAKKSHRRQSPSSAHRTVKTRIDKIRAIWIQMHRDGFISDGSETALMAWVRKQTAAKDGKIDALEWLEQTSMANKILEQLKRWDKRVRDAALNEDLLLISVLVRWSEEQGRSLSQADATIRLLQQRVITWHPLFADAGHIQQPGYATCRIGLQPLAMVIGSEATQCK